MSDVVIPVANVQTRPKGYVRIQHGAISSLFAISDALVVLIASIAGGSGYQIFLNQSVGDLSLYFGFGLIAALGYIAIGRLFLRLYRLPYLLDPRLDYVKILIGWLSVILLLVLILFLFKVSDQVSRGSVSCILVTGAILLPLWRTFAKQILIQQFSRGTISGRRAILIGTVSDLASLVADDLLLRFGIEEIERVALPDHDSAHPSVSRHEIAAMDAGIERARRSSVQEIVLAFPWRRSRQFEFVCQRLRETPLPVRLLPDHKFISSILRRSARPHFHFVPVDIQHGPLTRTEQIIKRFFDLVIAGGSLLALAPLLLIVGLLIRLDSRGPVIFRQRRSGFNGREFVIYKFRTMNVMEFDSQVVQARARDARVTRIGALLRRWSIDELPQLFNVVKGDMSIIGPRPHAVAHDDKYGALIASYAFRFHVKPGITGLAQIKGFRGETPRVEQMENRIALDLQYINNWSFQLDLQILAQTAVALVNGRNAH